MLRDTHSLMSSFIKCLRGKQKTVGKDSNRASLEKSREQQDSVQDPLSLAAGAEREFRAVRAITPGASKCLQVACPRASGESRTELQSLTSGTTESKRPESLCVSRGKNHTLFRNNFSNSNLPLLLHHLTINVKANHVCLQTCSESCLVAGQSSSRTSLSWVLLKNF